MQDPSQTVFAVVLAAGKSSRFGTNKQTVEFDGVPIVRRAVDVGTSVCGDRVLTVLGHEAATVLRALNANAGFVIVNEAYETGLGSSIAAAVRVLPPQAAALLLLLADQVLVTPEHLRSLLGQWSGADNEIVATAFAGTVGPPALLPRATFEDLRNLTGDAGARGLFRDQRFGLKTVRFEAAAADVDTPSDLTRTVRQPTVRPV